MRVLWVGTRSSMSYPAEKYLPLSLYKHDDESNWNKTPMIRGHPMFELSSKLLLFIYLSMHLFIYYYYYIITNVLYDHEHDGQHTPISPTSFTGWTSLACIMNEHSIPIELSCLPLMQTKILTCIKMRFNVFHMQYHPIVSVFSPWVPLTMT